MMRPTARMCAHSSSSLLSLARVSCTTPFMGNSDKIRKVEIGNRLNRDRHRDLPHLWEMAEGEWRMQRPA